MILDVQFPAICCGPEASLIKNPGDDIIDRLGLCGADLTILRYCQQRTAFQFIFPFVNWCIAIPNPSRNVSIKELRRPSSEGIIFKYNFFASGRMTFFNIPFPDHS